jgi:hypothetical protein
MINNQKVRICELEPASYDPIPEPMYPKTLDWETIFYNITLEDCNYILRLLFKNLLSGDTISENKSPFDEIVYYDIMIRSETIFLDITVRNSKNGNNQKFYLIYNRVSDYFHVSLGSSYPETKHTAVILIYEYFKNKSNNANTLLSAVAHQKIDLIKEYLEPTGITITELMDRNAYASLCQLLDAYLLEAVRNSG